MEFVNSRPTVFGAIPLGARARRMNDFHVKRTRIEHNPTRHDHFGDDGNGGFRLFHRRGEQGDASKDGGRRGRLLWRPRGKKDLKTREATPLAFCAKRRNHGVLVGWAERPSWSDV